MLHIGRSELLEAVQNEILAHASDIRLTWEAEEGKAPATMMELAQAISLASAEELRDFLKARVHAIPWDGGYIIARWKKGGHID